MTNLEHEREAGRMKAAATRLRTKAKSAGLLAEKISLYAAAKRIDADLQEHRLAYYQLVTEV